MAVLLTFLAAYSFAWVIIGAVATSSRSGKAGSRGGVLRW
jgi:hypothetical protein